MPEKLITYTQNSTVYRTDGDHLGHVKLGLLRYAQQVATAHAEAVGLNDALYRKTHTAYVLACWPCTSHGCPCGRGTDPCHSSPSAASAPSTSASPIFTMPTGQRSPQWTAAGYSLIPKSV